jgi:FkbM family methyltransferase
MKLNLKILGLNLIQLISPWIQIVTLQNWLIKYIIIKFLDPQILPKKLVPRPLWRLSGDILCNPYAFTHMRPYWFGRLYEIHVDRYLRRNLALGDTFIDVGCNCGHHTIMSACLVGQTGKVIAFEPNRELAVSVNEHICEEGFDQIILHPVGLSTERSTAILCKKGVVGGCSQVALPGKIKQVNKDESVECDIHVGDEIIQSQQLKGRVLLKVDVEGLEIDVLRGMQSILTNFVDQAIIEVTPKFLGGKEGIEELFNLMNDVGFEGYQLLQNGKAGQLIIADKVNKKMDVLFLRKRKIG